MTVESDDLTFDHLGHASVRIESADGTVIYIDPWADVIDDEPRDGDVVLVTHDDPDHYDPTGIHNVAGPEATIAVFQAVDTGDLDQDGTPLPLADEVNLGGVHVKTIPSYNDPAGDRVDEDGIPFHAEGEVIGLLVTMSETTVYYPSDTDFLDHHRRVDTDVFLPPIGGHYTMDRHEAAAFARAINPTLVLPVHYDTFEPIKTDATAFAQELEGDGIRVELF